MAANRIKGLTIEINGDTSKLSDSLKKVDTSLKNTQAQLKDVDKLLKLDPKNTDLLKQKQELLGKQVDDTKQRLQQLRDAQDQMDSNGIDRNSDQYKALQREIVETENKLKNAQDAAKDFGSIMGQQLQAVGQSVKEVGDKVTSVGDSLTKNVTAPIMAVGGASIAAFTQVDSGLDIIVQKTGATGEALDDMQSRASNIAKTIPTSFETAGNAVGELNTRFGLTGDELEELSTTFIKFADINGTDVVGSIDQAQKTLSAWGKTSEDAAGYLDVLNKVGQDTGISIDSLQSGLMTNATAFQEMGLSIDQAAVLMGQMEKSGANSSTVMGGLQKALKNATKDGKDMKTALSDLQKSIQNGTDGVDGLTAAYDLFGKSGDQIYNAIKAGTLDFESLGDTAIDAGGSVGDTFDAMQDPIDNFQVVLNNLMELGYEIGNAIMPLIQQAVEAVIPIIEKITGWWKSLDEGQQNFIVTAGLVVAAIGPVITIIGTLISTVGTIISGIGALSGVITTMSTIFSGPVVLAIGAVVAAGVLLWQNWDTVKEKASALWEKISEVFNNIKNTISEKIDAAKTAVHDGIEKIKGFFNFQFTWPKMKVPHFSVAGSLNPINWLKDGLPKISVEWYAKAMNQPRILDGATIFGASNGKLLGGGEAGREVVMGYDRLKEMVGQNVTINMTVNAAKGQSEIEIAREVSRQINNEVMRRKAVW